jgi:flagellar biosynthesis protein FlhG
VEQGKDVLVIDECLGDYSVSAMLGGVRGAGTSPPWYAARCCSRPPSRVMHWAFQCWRLAQQSRRLHGGAIDRVVLDGPADIVLIDAQLDRLGQLSRWRCRRTTC